MRDERVDERGQKVSERGEGPPLRSSEQTVLKEKTVNSN